MKCLLPDFCGRFLSKISISKGHSQVSTSLNLPGKHRLKLTSNTVNVFSIGIFFLRCIVLKQEKREISYTQKFVLKWENESSYWMTSFKYPNASFKRFVLLGHKSPYFEQKNDRHHPLSTVQITCNMMI